MSTFNTVFEKPIDLIILQDITADFHSIRTKTDASPAHVTSGFYKVEAGPVLAANYAFEEAKYVLNGQIDVFVSHLPIRQDAGFDQLLAWTIEGRLDC